MNDNRKYWLGEILAALAFTALLATPLWAPIWAQYILEVTQ